MEWGQQRKWKHNKTKKTKENKERKEANTDIKANVNLIPNGNKKRPLQPRVRGGGGRNAVSTDPATGKPEFLLLPESILPPGHSKQQGDHRVWIRPSYHPKTNNASPGSTNARPQIEEGTTSPGSQQKYFHHGRSTPRPDTRYTLIPRRQTSAAISAAAATAA